MNIKVLQIDPVNSDGSLVAVVESEQQLKESRFAAPRGTYEAHLRPSFDVETDIV